MVVDIGGGTNRKSRSCPLGGNRFLSAAPCRVAADKDDEARSSPTNPPAPITCWSGEARPSAIKKPIAFGLPVPDYGERPDELEIKDGDR